MASRRNKYNTYVEPRMIEIKGWIRNGMIDKEVAKKLRIAYSTFREYIKKYPELAALVYESKEVADLMVENSLFKAANGYEHEEVKTVRQLKRDDDGNIKIDEEGNEEFRVVEITTTKKRVQGNVTAQQFWLKNRNPAIWRDRFDNNISGSVGFVCADDETIEKLLGVNLNEKA